MSDHTFCVGAQGTMPGFCSDTGPGTPCSPGDDMGPDATSTDAKTTPIAGNDDGGCSVGGQAGSGFVLLLLAALWFLGRKSASPRR